MYVAVYPYQSDEAGDLTFNVQDLIQVTKMDGDWWTGSIGDRTGIFPANYVKKSEIQASVLICLDKSIYLPDREILYSYFMPVGSIVKTITLRCCG